MSVSRIASNHTRSNSKCSRWSLWFILSVVLCATYAMASVTEKPRLLVLTDIGDDPDDEQSLIRLLLYANSFDIEGIVTEYWLKTHDGRHGPLTPETQMELVHRMLNLYGQVLPNLDRHAKGYPRLDALRKLVKRGKTNVKMTLDGAKGDPMQWIGSGQNTEGSDWIIKVVDRNDPRPVDIAVWGGPADLAQALLRVREERSPAELAAFIKRIRVHAISDQDDTGPWIRQNFRTCFTSWITIQRGTNGNPVIAACFMGGTSP